MTEPLVLAEIKNGIGCLSLNRPQALNSLNLEMMRVLDQALSKWQDDNRVQAVIIDSTNQRFFCAGGDVRSFYYMKQENDWSTIDALFRTEYTLNYRIHSYNKPYISFLDGFGMGGGLGISLHGSHRIVTENSMLTMPETDIGFFTDVGGTRFLNRCPGQIGLYLALTSAQVKAADAIYIGWGTHFIPSKKLPDLKQQVLNLPNKTHDTITDLLNQSSESPGNAPITAMEQEINHLFSAQTFDGLMENLSQHKSEFSLSILNSFKRKSPTSLKIIFKQLSNGNDLQFSELMQREFRLSQRFTRDNDFAEGVRALLIDKDKNPQWQPPTLNEVTEDKIQEYFSPLDSNELDLTKVK